MTVKDRTLLRAAVSGDIPDNGVAAVSAADVRNSIIDVVDSYLNSAPTSNDVASSGDAGTLTGTLPLLWSPVLLNFALEALATGLTTPLVGSLTGNVDTNGYAITSLNGGDVYINPHTDGAIGPTGTNEMGNYATNFQRKFTLITQTTSGNYSVIGGGADNMVDGPSTFGIIVGGTGNITDEPYGIVVGGRENRSRELGSVIVGGTGNDSASKFTFIGGGKDNVAGVVGQPSANAYAVVLGGSGNEATGKLSTIVGGEGNIASSTNSFIANGSFNQALGAQAIILGGNNNIIRSSNAYGTIISSRDCVLSGIGSYNMIMGGRFNLNFGDDKCVMIGGYSNEIADGIASTYNIIIGGLDNEITGIATAANNMILGGNNNKVIGSQNIVVGGFSNEVSGTLNFLGGSSSNRVSGASTSAIVAGGSNLMDEKGGLIANAFIGGGANNQILHNGSFSTVVGGSLNILEDSLFGLIGGGVSNIVSGNGAIIAGGRENNALGTYAFIGGGSGNINTSSHSSAIVGGRKNKVIGSDHFVGGGTGNIVESGVCSSILGGVLNTVGQTSSLSIIGGGSGNILQQASIGSFMGAGILNLATGDASILIGGQENESTGNFNFLGGGKANKLRGAYGVVVGGLNNEVRGTGLAQNESSFLGGGKSNIIYSSRYAGMIGGINNNVNRSYSSCIVGGGSSTINATAPGFVNYSFVGGGRSNQVFGSNYSFVGGGRNNLIISSTHHYSAILGGAFNGVYGSHAIIAGGRFNDVSGDYSAIVGGHTNSINSGSDYAGILGGKYNTIDSGHHSFIIGSQGVISNANSGIQIGAGTLTRTKMVQIGSSISIPQNSGVPTTFKNGDIYQQDNAIYLNSRSKQWTSRGEVKLISSMTPSASGAASVTITGDSTPVESLIPTFAFDDTSAEYMDYLVYMDRNYASGGIDLQLCFSSEATGYVVWEGAFRRLNNGEDLSSSHAFTFNSVRGEISASREVGYTTISFANTDIDSWTSDEYAILRVLRNTASGEDTLVGDSNLITFNAYETV